MPTNPATLQDAATLLKAPSAHRHVRSYVLRKRHLKSHHEKAWQKYWEKYGQPKNLPLAADKRFILEIGFGNGETLLSLAQNHPNENFLGIEVFRPGIARLMIQAEAQGLANIKILHCDARQALSQILPPASCKRLLILFPDPWPKRRHQKRRLINRSFSALLLRVLLPNAQLHIATDDTRYAEDMLNFLGTERQLQNASQSGERFCQPPPWWVGTRFQAKGKHAGRTTHHLLFRCL